MINRSVGLSLWFWIDKVPEVTAFNQIGRIDVRAGLAGLVFVRDWPCLTFCLDWPVFWLCPLDQVAVLTGLAGLVLVRDWLACSFRPDWPG